MKRLSKESFWYTYHKNMDPTATGGLKDRIKASAVYRFLKRFDQAYWYHHILYHLVPRYLPQGSQYTLFEVGCAPGKHLLRLNRKFGYQPCGVDYAAEGVRINKQLLDEAGIDASGIHHADFFSDAFHKEHKEGYDIVASHGFIEHFDDPRPVVERHLNLAKPGGYLFVTIPNYRGLGRVQMQIMDSSQFEIHNLEIMRREPFAALFDWPSLDVLYCDYAGTFNFIMLDNPGSVPRTLLTRSILPFQRALDSLAIALDFKGFETPFLSPRLVFIGRKARKSNRS